MTLRHITAIYFNGHAEAAKKRVQRLKAAGYLNQRSRRVNEPAIYHISKKAFEVLRQQQTLDGYPQLSWPAHEKRFRISHLTLRHELEVMDVKAAFVTAATKTPRIEIAEFSTWPAMYQFKSRRLSSDGFGRENILVKPDGYIRIKYVREGNPMEHRLFLEVDRSTETLVTLLRRIICYHDYYRSGGLAKRYGFPHSQYKRVPFRVLAVFRTTDRLRNVEEQLLLLRPPMRNFVWLATFDAIVRDPMAMTTPS